MLHAGADATHALARLWTLTWRGAWLQVLEGLLEAYSGCVLIVSHDKAFMEHVVDSMLVLDGSGKVEVCLHDPCATSCSGCV
jgi:translation initiation factor RLI1